MSSRLDSTNKQINQSTSIKSTTSNYTDKLRTQFNDPTLGEYFVRSVLAKLGEAELNNIAEFAMKTARNPGRMFVSMCNNEMIDRGLKPSPQMYE